MPVRFDTALDLSPKCPSKYIVASNHRKLGNPNKCIWTIKPTDEVKCFVFGVSSKWVTSSIGWGLY